MTTSKWKRAVLLRATGAVLAALPIVPGLAMAEQTPPQPVASAGWSSSPRLLVLYVTLLIAFLLALHLVDSLQAYSFSRESRDKLLGKLQGELPPDQLAKVANQLAPTGIQGTTRSILAYALLLILGVAVFHLVAVSKFDKAPEYADKILTVLAGSLASIVGFYFGSKASTEAASEPAKRPDAPQSSPAKIAEIIPNEAAPGDSVKIQGTGFGDNPGSVKFGVVPARDVEKWKATSITVEVPKAEEGPTPVTVNPAHDKEIVGSPELFKVCKKTAPGAADVPEPIVQVAPSQTRQAPKDLASDEGSFEVGGGV